MNFWDLFTLILDNLSRRKARVALTAIGVVIGTSAVVVLVSLGIGLQRSATEQLYGISDLARIDVSPGYTEPGMNGKGSGGGGGGGGSAPPEMKLLTESAIAEIAAIPGIASIIPRDYIYGEAYLKLGKLETYAGIIGVGTKDLSEMGLTPQAGSMTLSKGTMIVGVMTARNFYDPNYRPDQEAPPPPELYDQTLKLELVKYTQDGTRVVKTIPVKVVGVSAETRGEADWSFYMSLEDLTTYNEWFSGRRINRNKEGYQALLVRASDPRQAADIAEQITALGYQAYTPQSFVEGINSFYVVLQVVFGGVGAIALLVAAIGITNTMAMAILERTREIGLMKALGATNRDVLTVFLGEAAGIGFLGGVGGVILGWSAGQVINVLALGYLAAQAAEQGGPPPTNAVFTPLWLPAFAVIFATLVGLLSGLYPALRAATLVPVNALKYE